MVFSAVLSDVNIPCCIPWVYVTWWGNFGYQPCCKKCYWSSSPTAGLAQATLFKWKSNWVLLHSHSVSCIGARPEVSLSAHLITTLAGTLRHLQLLPMVPKHRNIVLRKWNIQLKYCTTLQLVVAHYYYTWWPTSFKHTLYTLSMTKILEPLIDKDIFMVRLCPGRTSVMFLMDFLSYYCFLKILTQTVLILPILLLLRT